MKRDFPGPDHLVDSIWADDFQECFHLTRIPGYLEYVVVRRGRYDPGTKDLGLAEQRSTFPLGRVHSNQEKLALDTVRFREIDSFDDFCQLVCLMEDLVCEARLAAHHHGDLRKPCLGIAGGGDGLL